MSGGLVTISFEMPDYLERYRSQFSRILLGIAADIQTNVGLRFANEGAYNGHEKWQDLASGKNLKKAKNGLQERQILAKSGTLKNSFGPKDPSPDFPTPGPQGYIRFEGDDKNAVVKVGTTVKYAKIHNEGGVIQHPGTDNGFGRGIKIKAHSIKIPKRNFTDWSDADAKNMKIMLKNLLDVLNGN